MAIPNIVFKLEKDFLPFSNIEMILKVEWVKVVVYFI